MSTTTVQDQPNIPAEMLSEPRWVAWRYVMRDGKQTKVPINPQTGGYASATDPRTWGSHADTMRRAANDGLAGVGFMLGDGWVGIDFDEFRDEKSGHLFAPVPQAVAQFKTYAEVSPSKRGVKIIGRGKLPDDLRNRSPKDPTTGQQIEVYDTARFFTVTGERVEEAPLEIVEMPDTFEVFCHTFLPEKKDPGEGSGGVVGPGSILTDEEVTALILGGTGERGDKYRALWEGDTSYHAGDDSRADAAMVNELVYYTGGDLEQADRLFRQSGLYRDKWERADYRMRTFTFAMSGREPRDFYSHGRDLESVLPPLEDLALGFATPSPIHNYMREGIEDPPILVKGLLYDGTAYPNGQTEGSVHTWYGEPGCGKSMVALWASIEVMRKRENVVYIDEEGTKRMITERLTGLGATPEEIEAHFFYYNSPNLTTDKAHQKQLMNIADALRPGLVIFDSWIDFLANDGRNENSSDEVIGWAMAVSKAFVNLGATVVLLDHVTKDGSGRGARGSGGKLGWVMAGHKVKVNAPFDRHTVGEVQFIRQKDREGALPSVVSFTIGGDGTGKITCEPDTRGINVVYDGLSVATRAILDALPSDGLGFNAWFKATGLRSKDTFSRHVGKLTAAGQLEREGTLYIPVTTSPVVRSESGPTEEIGGPVRSGPYPLGTDRPDQDQEDPEARATERPKAGGYIEKIKKREERIASMAKDLAASDQQFRNPGAFEAEVARRADAKRDDVARVVNRLLSAGDLTPASVGIDY